MNFPRLFLTTSMYIDSAIYYAWSIKLYALRKFLHISRCTEAQFKSLISPREKYKKSSFSDNTKLKRCFVKLLCKIILRHTHTHKGSECLQKHSIYQKRYPCDEFKLHANPPHVAFWESLAKNSVCILKDKYQFCMGITTPLRHSVHNVCGIDKSCSSLLNFKDLFIQFISV